jgi:hypothetical protein
LHVEERAQRRDRSAQHWHWQRLHPGGATETHRRIVNHPPTGGVDLDCSPGLVAKIEIEPVIQPADADEHWPFRSVKMRSRLDDV